MPTLLYVAIRNENYKIAVFLAITGMGSLSYEHLVKQNYLDVLGWNPILSTFTAGRNTAK